MSNIMMTLYKIILNISITFITVKIIDPPGYYVDYCFKNLRN